MSMKPPAQTSADARTNTPQENPDEAPFDPEDWIIDGNDDDLGMSFIIVGAHVERQAAANKTQERKQRSAGRGAASQKASKN